MKPVNYQNLHLLVNHPRVLLFFLVAQLLLQGAQGSQISFSLHLIRANDTSALFRWTDLPIVPAISHCKFSQTEPGSTEIHILATFPPDSGEKVLAHLQPDTVYEVSMSCTSGEVSFWSSPVNFTTAHTGEYYTVPQPSATTFEVSPTTADPEVTRTRLSQKPSAVTDIAIGVCFGLIGLAVLITMVYYITLKFRRHQRIQRFLQYRQHENDPFPDFNDQEQDGEEYQS